jgi:hypothetical protein
METGHTVRSGPATNSRTILKSGVPIPGFEASVDHGKTVESYVCPTP